MFVYAHTSTHITASYTVPGPTGEPVNRALLVGVRGPFPKALSMFSIYILYTGNLLREILHGRILDSYATINRQMLG